MSTGPIFLAGTDRSGIGLVAEILDAHPEIAISRRTNFWRFYDRRFGDLAIPVNLERCVDEMLRYRRITDLGVDRAELLEQLRQGTPTYGRLFDAIQRQHLRNRGRRRWGDKSLNTEGHVRRVFREFPDARVIHVLRDPRDRYASQASHRGASRGGLGAGTDLWCWSAGRARRNGERYGDRYSVVRYEDLVAGAAEVIEDLCAFLGEERAPQMMPRPGTGAPVDRSEPWPRPINADSVGRYRRDLTAREIASIQRTAGRMMRRFGYRTDDVRLTRGERILASSVDVPAHVGAGLASRVRREVTRFERDRPSQRRVV
jgi:hypothetical protein